MNTLEDALTKPLDSFTCFHLADDIVVAIQIFSYSGRVSNQAGLDCYQRRGHDECKTRACEAFTKPEVTRRQIPFPFALLTDQNHVKISSTSRNRKV